MRQNKSSFSITQLGRGFLFFVGMVLYPTLLLQSTSVTADSQQMVLWFFSCLPLCCILKLVDWNHTLEHHQMTVFTDKHTLRRNNSIFQGLRL